MRKIAAIVFLGFLLTLPGCEIFFVNQPTSAKSGSAIDIEVSITQFAAAEEAPIISLAVPVTWSVLSASYSGTTDGTTPISGEGTYSQEDSDFLNTNYPISGFEWKSYRALEAEYTSDASGTMSFQVAIGTNGTYSLMYALHFDSWLYYTASFAEKKIVVGGFADYLDDWHSASSPHEYSSLYAVTYGSGTFVAVGDSGEISSSTDAETWHQRSSGTSALLYGVSYGSETFVAVGQAGTILTSAEGITWTQRISGVSNELSGVAYGNGVFAVVGDSGVVLTSPDAVSWTQRSSGTSNYLLAVAYGNGTFVAVSPYGEIFTSPDGAMWTLRSSGVWASHHGVAFGNGIFIVVGDYTGVLTSTDGVTWTERDTGSSSIHYGVAYGNETFTVVGLSGNIMTSGDAVTWTERSSGTSLSLRNVAYGNKTFVAVGNDLILMTKLIEPSGGGGCFITSSGQ